MTSRLTNRMYSERRRRTQKARLLSRRRIEGDCWVWTGYCHPHGYGAKRFRNRYGYQTVHRIAAWVWLGLDLDLDSKLVVHHTCRCRNCFNPDHLEIMTRADHTKLHASTA